MGDKVIEMSARDRLRAKTVGAAKRFKEEIVEWEGEKFLIRQPSVAQRSAILQKARVKTDEQGKVADMDMAVLQVWAAICCTYVPGEDKPLFEEADVENLMGQPSGGFVDLFGNTALKLMNVEAEKDGKNSVETPNGSSSSQ